jgi:kumamolisin
VLGLDDRPQTRIHFRVHPSAAATDAYTPPDVAARYGFPTDVTGAGQTVAVIELGGGYDVDDHQTYFIDHGLAFPTVTAVAVDGAANIPGGDADGEVMLDIEAIGAIAQGAGIIIYFAPNTTEGLYNAVAAAIHDQTYRPSIISISSGQAEAGWTAQATQSYDALFVDAGAAGITVYAAAGDGANDNAGGSSLNVDLPDSSPNVVGCGGTSLAADSETVWNGNGATGGGVSRQFDLPAHQADAGVPPNPDSNPGRGVPDVAGDADPATGYRVRVDGSDTVIGGTSAVAPLWAALTALANEGASGGRRSAHPPLRHTRRTPRHHQRRQQRVTWPAPAGTRARAWAYPMGPPPSAYCEAEAQGP